MKNKWILSLLAVLLMTAMLLPLASCMPSGQSGAGTTESVPTEAPAPTEEGLVETPSEPVNPNIIPHTPAMLALQEKWESSDEEWTKKVSEGVFLPTTKDMECRKEEKYRIRINNADEATLRKIYERAYEVEIPEENWQINSTATLGFVVSLWASPEQIETLAKVDGDFTLERYMPKWMEYN